MKQTLVLSIVLVAGGSITCATFGWTARQVTIEQAGVIEANALAGMVVDAVQFPIPQVLVEQLSPDGKRVDAVLTDSKGRFKMNSPGPAVYAVRASKPGFDSLLVKVNVSKTAKKELRLILTVSH